MNKTHTIRRISSKTTYEILRFWLYENQGKTKAYSEMSTLDVGVYLSSRAVTSQVLSARVSLTTVFGMGTGGPSPLTTPTISQLSPQHPYSITLSHFCQVSLSQDVHLRTHPVRDGTPSGTRTLDTLIKSQVLYQLS